MKLVEKEKKKQEEFPKQTQNIPTGKIKLSFKEKKELEELELLLENLEKEKTRIWKQPSAMDYCSLMKLLKNTNRLGVVIQLIDEKGDRWLELSSI
ncbi:MAG: hypothetical protein HC905_18370 [Bacteroidales bacterium]|nr:hypothetical protein [Bacteroidales bacterium]